MVPVNAGKFLVPLVFWDSKVIVKPGLSPPAQVEGRGHMGLAPLHDHGQFFPVIDLLKLHHLHRSPCDDHAVVLFPLYIRKRHIKLVQMAGRGVLGLVGAEHEKGTVDLQRRIGQRAQQLSLRVLFHRHQVQDQDLQGPDILTHGPILIHHENIFRLQNRPGRKVLLDFNGHGILLPGVLRDLLPTR